MAVLTTKICEKMSALMLNAKAWVVGLSLAFVVSLAWCHAVLAAEGEEGSLKPSYRLGIFPYLPALTIDRLYGPVAEAFSFELDRLVKLRTKTTFENFEAAVAAQSYDIIFVHPFFLVDAIDYHSYLPLARLAKPMKAILVVRDDSPAMSIDDLVGGTIGLPPKLAAVSQLIKAGLADVNLRPGLDIGVRHFRNKASCLEAVLAGAVAACGLPSFVLSQVAEFKKHPVRVVFKAPAVNHFAFAVHKRVAEGERNQLLELLLSWSDRGSDMVRMIGLDQGFVRASSDDYADIRDYGARLQSLAQR